MSLKANLEVMKHNFSLPACGLLYGSDVHHLDHIAPLCAILGIPLIFTEVSLKLLCDQTYPNLETRLASAAQLAESLLPEFDVVFSCLPTQLLDPLFSLEEENYSKKLLFVWLPHGNSDKDNLAALICEKFLLIYGKQMRETLSKKGVLKKVQHVISIGNFRKLFYIYYKRHFDDLVRPLIQFKQKAKKTLLYAPTWGGEDLNQNSFSLLKNLPPEYNLIVKFHPNTLYTGFAIALKEAFSEHENIKFVDDLPLIYPLLFHTDIYIGDHSSIAYDFLSLDAPLYFFSGGTTPIHLAGTVTTPEKIFDLIAQEKDPHREIRMRLNEYAFEPTPFLDAIPLLIDQGVARYFNTLAPFN